MYCPKCGLRVAPFEPMKVKVGDTVYHGKCYVSQVQKKMQPVKKTRQSYFHFTGSIAVN